MCEFHNHRRAAIALTFLSWLAKSGRYTHNPAPRDWLCKGNPVTARILRCGPAYPAFAILGRSWIECRAQSVRDPCWK